MREIKFRAWDKENNCMIEDWYVITIERDDAFLGRQAQTLGHEIMQFTGLKDKNGKEIYEGDIIKAIYEHKEEFGEVFYDEEHGLFDVRGNLWKSCEDLYCSEKYYEVIGNIYENQELLDAKQNLDGKEKKK